MVTVRTTEEFDSWLGGLRDQRAMARITSRIKAIERGVRGDVKSLSRYSAQHGVDLVILLCGGDKRRQDADIRRARAMLAELE